MGTKYRRYPPPVIQYSKWSCIHPYHSNYRQLHHNIIKKSNYNRRYCKKNQHPFLLYRIILTFQFLFLQLDSIYKILYMLIKITFPKQYCIGILFFRKQSSKQLSISFLCFLYCIINNILYIFHYNIFLICIYCVNFSR